MWLPTKNYKFDDIPGFLWGTRNELAGSILSIIQPKYSALLQWKIAGRTVPTTQHWAA